MSELNRPASRRIAYLYSRYPVISQTFCDSEMLELEALGIELTIGSLHPPLDTFRHERQRQFRAEVLYPPPPAIVKARVEEAHEFARWEDRVLPLVERHRRDYGKACKPEVRARNALYFATAFQERGIGHVHVHFANRATHTALFIKALAGIPFSFTAHAQDFMVDLGNDDLLREMCREAEFIIAVSDWSRQLLRETCPESAGKIERIYNGIRLEDFPRAHPGREGMLKMVSVGRLIEFKGLHHLLAACSLLKERGVAFSCTIIGEGPWRNRLEAQRDELGLSEAEIVFAGARTQEEVKAELAASHLFVLPSIIDSKGASDILPTVIMEAMAAHLPVVSTRLVGIPEMVEDGKTGILVPPADEMALANALERLAGDAGLRRTLGEAGCERARERFQRSANARDLARRFEAGPGAKRERRPVPRLLYVVDTWPVPDDPLLGEELAHVATRHDEIQVMACAAAPGLRHDAMGPEERELLRRMEWLPDAMVLEADWMHASESREILIRLRDEVSAELSTERYFLEARRALGLAGLVRKRGIRHVHAARGGAALTAWMVWRLGAVERFSFAAEERSGLDGKILDRLERDAAMWSRTGGDADRLDLARPPMRRVQLGPLKIRLGRASRGDRTTIYEAWTKQLLALNGSETVGER